MAAQSTADILNQIPVVDPDGVPGVVPPEDWPKAKEQGFTQAVFATSPEGKLGILHPHDAAAAVKQGFKIGQPTPQFDAQRYSIKIPGGGELTAPPAVNPHEGFLSGVKTAFIEGPANLAHNVKESVLAPFHVAQEGARQLGNYAGATAESLNPGELADIPITLPGGPGNEATPVQTAIPGNSIVSAEKNVVAPAARAGTSFLEGQYDPATLATMGALKYLPEGSAALRLLKSAAGGYYGAKMGVGAVKEGTKAVESAAQGDVPSAVEHGTSALMQGAMAGESGADTVRALRSAPGDVREAAGNAVEAARSAVPAIREVAGAITPPFPEAIGTRLPSFLRTPAMEAARNERLAPKRASNLAAAAEMGGRPPKGVSTFEDVATPILDPLRTVLAEKGRKPGDYEGREGYQLAQEDTGDLRQRYDDAYRALVDPLRGDYAGDAAKRAGMDAVNKIIGDADLMDRLKGTNDADKVLNIGREIASARTIGDLDETRIALNRLATKYMGKAEGQQYESPILQEALAGAADSIRNQLYGRMSELYGGMSTPTEIGPDGNTVPAESRGITEEQIRELQREHGAAIKLDQMTQGAANRLSSVASEEGARPGLFTRLRGLGYRATMGSKEHAAAGLLEKLFPPSEVKLFNTRMGRVAKGAKPGELNFPQPPITGEYVEPRTEGPMGGPPRRLGAGPAEAEVLPPEAPRRLPPGNDNALPPGQYEANPSPLEPLLRPRQPQLQPNREIVPPSRRLPPMTLSDRGAPEASNQVEAVGIPPTAEATALDEHARKKAALPILRRTPPPDESAPPAAAPAPAPTSPPAPAAPKAELPPWVSPSDLADLNQRIERAQAKIDKNRTITEAPQRVPGPMVAGPSGYTMGKALDAENNRRAAAFKELQQAQKDVAWYSNIRDGYLAGRNWPNGQPRRPGAVEARAAAQERTAAKVASQGFDTREIHHRLGIDGSYKLADGRVVSYDLDFDTPGHGYRYKVESPNGSVQYGQWHPSISKVQASGELPKLLKSTPAAAPEAPPDRRLNLDRRIAQDVTLSHLRRQVADAKSPEEKADAQYALDRELAAIRGLPLPPNPHAGLPGKLKGKAAAQEQPGEAPSLPAVLKRGKGVVKLPKAQPPSPAEKSGEAKRNPEFYRAAEELYPGQRITTDEQVAKVTQRAAELERAAAEHQKAAAVHQEALNREASARTSLKAAESLSPDDQQAFRDGVMMENGRVGKDAHDYGRVTAGIANVMEAHGVKPSLRPQYIKQSGSPLYWELSDLFHSPLASMNPKMSVGEIGKAMDAVLPDSVPEVDHRGWRFRDAFEMGRASSVMEKELASGKFGEELSAAQKTADAMHRKAELVQALIGDTENVKKANAAADALESRVSELKNRAQDKIDAAKEKEAEEARALKERPMTLAKKIQPIEAATWTPKQAWVGNLVKPGEKTPWISDGHSAINLDFVERAKTMNMAGERPFSAKVKKLIEPYPHNGRPISAEVVHQTVAAASKGSTTPGEILGFHSKEDLGDDKMAAAYIENTASHKLIPVQAPILRMVLDTVKPDSIKVGNEHSAVAFYRGDKLAAIVMPLRTEAEFHIATAKKTLAAMKAGEAPGSPAQRVQEAGEVKPSVPPFLRKRKK